MSIRYNDKSGGTPQEVLLAGTPATDLILNGTSKNPIANKTVYNALATKIESTVENLVNFYNKSQVYNKQEVRDLIGAINTLTIEVVNELPTQDISATTIYFLKQSGVNTYDEYIYVDNAWVKIGDTDIDLSGYLTTANFQIAIADYYTKSAIDAMIANYYTKTQVDAMVDAKQDELTFDNAPTAGSDNPVKSGGIKTALDAKQNTLTFDSTPTAGSSNPVTSDGIKTAIGAKKFSNPNLLDNGWFTVNQRGQTTYTNGYSLDRWSLRGTSKIDVISDGITFTSLRDDGANDSWIRELISVEEASLLIGKTLTYSVLTTDGVVTSWTLTLTSSNWSGAYKTVNGVQIRPTIEWGTEYVSILLWSKTYNVGLDIRAIKFEIGSESTLNLDTAPNYAVELAKCRASTVDSVDTFANQGQINVGTSNPNLLDNPWFTINQRGQSTYASATANRWCLDRWRFTTTLDVVVNSDTTITVTNTSSSFNWFGQQFVLQERGLNEGTVVTQSIMLSDGTIYSFTAPIPSGTNLVDKNIQENGIEKIRIQQLNGGIYHAVIFISANSSATIRAVKLELGTVSTLANDTAPNYQQELAKCQRYFVRLGYPNGSTYEPIGVGFAKSANQAYIYGSLPTEMRQSPSITLSGKVYCQSPTKGLTNAPCGTLHTSTDRGKNGYILYLTPDTENIFTSGEPLTAYFVQTSAGTNESYIDFSAEL